MLSRGSDWLLSDDDLAAFRARHPGPVVPRRDADPLPPDGPDGDETPNTASLRQRAEELPALRGAAYAAAQDRSGGYHGRFVEVTYTLPSGVWLRIGEQDLAAPIGLSSITLHRQGCTVRDLPSGERVVVVERDPHVTQVVLVAGDGHEVSVTALSAPGSTKEQAELERAQGMLHPDALLAIARRLRRA